MLLCHVSVCKGGHVADGVKQRAQTIAFGTRQYIQLDATLAGVIIAVDVRDKG